MSKAVQTKSTAQKQSADLSLQSVAESFLNEYGKTPARLKVVNEAM